MIMMQISWKSGGDNSCWNKRLFANQVTELLQIFRISIQALRCKYQFSNKIYSVSREIPIGLCNKLIGGLP